MVDKLIIGVLNNKAKCPLFSAQERVNMLKEVTASLPNVEIQSFEGLLIDFVRRNHADIVVRGLRAITDFEYELQMAQTNRVIAPRHRNAGERKRDFVHSGYGQSGGRRQEADTGCEHERGGQGF